MVNSDASEKRQGLQAAFALLSQALDILDGCGASDEIGPPIEEALSAISKALDQQLL